MKKIIFLLLGCFPLIIIAQNSYTVCNTPGVVADFASLQTAVDNVAPGSILYIFPGTNNYGSITISKRLNILGTGYMLDQNSEPATSPNTSGVVLDAFNFKPGSDNSLIEGLQFTANDATSSNNIYRLILDSVANITINRCFINLHDNGNPGNVLFYTRNAGNCIFNQCYLLMASPTVTHNLSGLFQEVGTGSNLQFNNNIIDGKYDATGFTMNQLPYNFLEPHGNIVFTNNTIIANLNQSRFCYYTYINNFFINIKPSEVIDPTAIQMNAATAANNITDAPNLFPAGTSNQQNANINSIFVSSTFGYHSPEQKWMVQPGSFANTYGAGGIQCGAYGGTHPYVLSGIPNLPYTYALTVATDTTLHGNVLLRIKAKASN